MMNVSVLIPTFNRADALAVTLTSLYYQQATNFDVVIADQSGIPVMQSRSPLQTAVRLLQQRGVNVAVHRNLPRRGMAQQRQFLLEHSNGRYSLFIDDDLVLEPYVIQMLASVLDGQQCGFAGSAVIGLSYRDDERLHEQAVEFFDGAVHVESVTPGDDKWQRHKLHNAANLLHVQRHHAARPEQPLLYKVAWVGGCVMYDTEKLRASGGFEFWRELPVAHCGEDVLAQLRVAEKYGGCGVMPSGAYHQELETTVRDRRVNAPEYLAPQSANTSQESRK